MKNIVNVIILALVISLGISVSKNYKLLQEVYTMQDYMSYSADLLKMNNDQKEKYHWNRGKLLKNTIFIYQMKPELFTEKGKLVEEYFKSIDDAESGTIRFYLEQERRSKLEAISKISLDNLFNEKFMNPRLDFKDELHLGFHENIIDNCIYEVHINGEHKDFNNTGIYECPMAPKVLIDLKRISINPETQNLDTICVSKFIARA